MQITAELMEEFRQDMIAEDWRDAQHEIKMRNDDDYFYDYLVDEYDTYLSVGTICKMYEREDQIDYWIELLIENSE